MFIRLEIATEDKIGVAFKILQKIYDENINLVAVEVFPRKVCVKIEGMSQEKKSSLKTSISKLQHVISISDVPLLYYEKNERKLMAVIDAVDDGIISINNDFKIEIFNKYCEKVFRYERDEVLQKDVRSLIGENAPMAELLKNGNSYDNVEIKFSNDRGQVHYMTTGRSIKDDNGKTVGSVAVVKDIGQVIELANAVNSTHEGAFSGVIGNSPKMDKVKKLAHTVAKGDSTILLRGESGTGKEVFARAIQKLSGRRNESFVTINCAALPDSLLESELFGYEKGSFTGALNSGKEGLFIQASNGTLFLDEIGELSLSLQAKLLRVLQEGVIRKIGSAKEQKVDVRIIAATNRNLEDMIAKGTFREDLYYRLNVIPIFIPPMRERMEDIPLLAGFFIEKLNAKLKKKITGFNDDFIRGLLSYNWPGNIRELQNVIERAMNLCEGKVLREEDLVIDLGEFYAAVKDGPYENERELTLTQVVEKCEKDTIAKALEKHKSLRKTAKALGVSHTTIMNKMNKYGINCKE